MSAVGTAYVRIRPQSAGFAAETRRQIQPALDSAERQARVSFGNVAKHAAGVGATLVGGLGVARVVSSVAQIGVAYQDSLNQVQAVTRATAPQIQQVSARAVQLGNDLRLPATSAADAGVAIEDLAKGGLTLRDSMSAARGALALATAGNLTVGDSATFTANALNAFQLKGTQATKVANVLANTANASSAEVNDLALGFQSAAQVAASAGFSVNDLAAVIGEFSSQGLKGEVAGTSFRSLLLSLEAPTKKAKGVLKDLNVSLTDQHGKMRPLRDIVEQFQHGTEHLTQAQRNQAFATIAGTYGVNALNILVRQGTTGLDHYEKATRRVNGVFDLAAAKSRGVGGAVRSLRSVLETEAIAVFQRVAPSVESNVRGLTAWILSVQKSGDAGRALDSVVSTVGAGFREVRGDIEQVGPPLLSVAGAIRSVVNEAGGLGTVIKTFIAFRAARAALSIGATTVAGVQNLAAGRAFGAAATTATAGSAAEASAAAAAQQRMAFAITEASAAMTTQTSAAARNTAALATLGAASSTSTASFTRQAAATEAAAASSVAGIGRSAAAAERSGGTLARFGTGLVNTIGKGNLIAAALAGAAFGFQRLSQEATSASAAMDRAAAAGDRVASAAERFKTATRTIGQARGDRTSDRINRDQALLDVAAARQQVNADREKHITNAQGLRDIVALRSALNQLHIAQQRVSADDARIARGNKTKADSARAFQRQTSQLADTVAAAARVSAATTPVLGRRQLRGFAQPEAAAADLTRESQRQAAAIAAAEKAFQDFANAHRAGQPVIARSAQLLHNYVAATGTIPTRAETLLVFNDSTARKRLAAATADALKKRSVVFDVKTSDLDGGLARVISKTRALERKKVLQILGLTTTPFDTQLTRAVKSSSTFAGKPIKPKAQLDISPFTAAINRAQGIAASRGPGIGSALSTGMASGVTAGPLTAALVGAVDRAVATAKAHARIKSPSGLTRDEIGIPLAQGIGAGLQGLDQALAGKLTAGIRGAVNQAKQSLNSITSTLAGQVGTFIDAVTARRLAGVDRSPAALALAGVTAQINQRQLDATHDQLQRQLAAAQAGLQTAQAATEGTPADRAKAITDAQQQVADAQRAIDDQALAEKQASLQAQLDAQRQGIQDEADQRKKATERDLADVADLFNRRLISLATYQRRVRQILAADGARYSKIGAELGIAFADGFRASVAGALGQASAISRGPRVTGSGLAPDISSPLAELRRELADARKAAADARKAAIDASGPGGKKITPGEQAQLDRLDATRHLLEQILASAQNPVNVTVLVDGKEVRAVVRSEVNRNAQAARR